MTELSTLFAILLVSSQAQPVTEATEPEVTQVTPEAAAEAKVEAEANEAAQEDVAANDDDKIICRRTAIVGSKFKKKICGTKKQWETLANRSSDSTREWQRRGKGLEPGDSNKPSGF